MCSQKFDLHMQFIKLLNTFVHVWVHAYVIANLSWKGLFLIILVTERTRFILERNIKFLSEGNTYIDFIRRSKLAYKQHQRQREKAWVYTNKLYIYKTKTFIYPRVIFWFLPNLETLAKIMKSVKSINLKTN